MGDINTKISSQLRKLTDASEDMKTENTEPFDGVFRVEGVPFEIHIKPEATLEDLELVIKLVEEFSRTKQINK